MTTFNDMFIQPQIDLLPEWMSDERSRYYDHMVYDRFATKGSSLWKAINRFFII